MPKSCADNAKRVFFSCYNAPHSRSPPTLPGLIVMTRRVDSKTTTSVHCGGPTTPGNDRVHDPTDDRTMMAKALGLAYAVISASLEMVAPIAIGYWLDNRYQTSPLFVLLGLVLGLAAWGWAMAQLVRPRRDRTKMSNTTPRRSDP